MRTVEVLMELNVISVTGSNTSMQKNDRFKSNIWIWYTQYFVSTNVIHAPLSCTTCTQQNVIFNMNNFYDRESKTHDASSSISQCVIQFKALCKNLH